MHRRGSKGFTILELAIVVTIIGILAALAIPLFSHIVKKSRISTLANDLRSHGQAIQRYALEMGEFPESWDVVGEMIPGTEGFVSMTWRQTSPIGGRYTWVYTQGSIPSNWIGYIQIVETATNPFSIKLSDMEDLDEDIDDGDISSGYLQVAGNRIRYFVKMSDG
ncbi:MAG TPA: prepilin-type N-terminal cleavage/methylation domain-containing protein [Oceanipulchritudo sp.]|nr:prepilin-type N-terminal cleavage/methylation domain-containing protein [Oceanipulchritudo sp.]